MFNHDSATVTSPTATATAACLIFNGNFIAHNYSSDPTVDFLNVSK